MWHEMERNAKVKEAAHVRDNTLTDARLKTWILFNLRLYCSCNVGSENMVAHQTIVQLWKVNWSTWHERGAKKKTESPRGIKPMTSRTTNGRSIHWATRTHGEQGLKHKPAFREVMRSIPVGYSDFLLVPRSYHTELKIHHLYLIVQLLSTWSGF